MKKNFNVVRSVSRRDLKSFYKGSALTIEGLDIDSIADYAEYLEQYSGLKESATFYVVTGKTMNENIKKPRYPNDCNIIVIMLNDLIDWKQMVIRRFEFGGKWFDDIVHNSGGFVASKAR